jgi:MtN3 and saliva related transmembrane protein
MKDVSLPMYILLVTGSVLWLSYGIMLKDTPLILANGVGLSFISLTFFMKIRYG